MTRAADTNSKFSVKPLTGRMVLIGLAIFFGTVFLVNGFMVFSALNTFNGVHTDDAYRKGRDYNDAIHQARAQAKLGWSVQVDQRTLGTGSDRRISLDATYTDANAGPVEALTVTAQLWRPTHEGFDRTAQLRASGPGRYSGLIEAPLAGQWELRLAAERGDGTRHDFRQWLMVTP